MSVDFSRMSENKGKDQKKTPPTRPTGRLVKAKSSDIKRGRIMFSRSRNNSNSPSKTKNKD